MLEGKKELYNTCRIGVFLLVTYGCVESLFSADSIVDPFFPRTTQILLEYQLGRWVPRLREPRDLYGVSSSGPLSPTRWPYHCEVIDEKVQHIGMFLGVWEVQTLADLL